MNKVSETVFTFTIPHSTYGFEFGARMTVVKLKSGKLWIHSPIPLTDDVRAKVSDLGEVSYLVAPNNFHHLYVKQWKDSFPQAQTFGSDGVQAKRKDFRFDQKIPENFENEIQSIFVEGAPMIQETVFYIPDQEALLTTDMILNIRSPQSWWTRFYLRMSGILDKPGVSAVFKKLYKDRKKSQESLNKLLKLDFKHLLVAHGEPVMNDGKKALGDSYQWLLQP